MKRYVIFWRTRTKSNCIKNSHLSKNWTRNRKFTFPLICVKFIRELLGIVFNFQETFQCLISQRKRTFKLFYNDSPFFISCPNLPFNWMKQFCWVDSHYWKQFPRQVKESWTWTKAWSALGKIGSYVWIISGGNKLCLQGCFSANFCDTKWSYRGKINANRLILNKFYYLIKFIFLGATSIQRVYHLINSISKFPKNNDARNNDRWDTTLLSIIGKLLIFCLNNSKPYLEMTSSVSEDTRKDNCLLLISLKIQNEPLVTETKKRFRFR